MEKQTTHTTRIEAVEFSTLAAQFGTPFYAYSARALRVAAERMWNLFNGKAQILFSVKANTNPSIVRSLYTNGCGAEIASVGELRIAEKAGIPADRIVFAGPGKREEELTAALMSGVHAINLESLGEARRLNNVAEHHGSRVRVTVRVNPTVEHQAAGMVMGGRPLQFGVDEDQIADVLPQIETMSALDLCGVHVYTGTQVLERSAIVSNFKTGTRIAQAFQEILHKPAQMLDIGLGIGVPLFEGEAAVDFDLLKQDLAPVLADVPKQVELYIEAGRALVAEAGYYVCSVIDLKTSRGERFAILDGGMHHHVAAAGGFGNIFHREFPMIVDRAIVDPNKIKTHLVGPCCTPLDSFSSSFQGPELLIGDLVIVKQSGAYGFSVSPLCFLSHPSPAEILVDGLDVQLIRRRRNTEDLFE